jgi:hypothetical protein
MSDDRLGPTAKDCFLAALARATEERADWHAFERPLTPDQVADVEWCQVQHGMLAEEAFAAKIRHVDGRILFVRGQCDTTGWGCIGNRWEMRDATDGDPWRADAWPEEKIE